MQLLINIDEEDYYNLVEHAKNYPPDIFMFAKIHNSIISGTPLPKGYGRLFDERDIVNGNYKIIGSRICGLEPIIEADKDYEVKVITRGNCRVCGKELCKGTH